MNIDVEYAIKKDIRNNPVIREVDTQQTREFRRIVLLAALTVGLLLFSVWQHVQMVTYGMDTEKLRSERAYEETVNRQLRLNVSTLRAPSEIERRARALGLQPPSIAETLVLERAIAAPAPGGIVARAR
jgi:cell division protein FtsL